jgi:putative redox protein
MATRHAIVTQVQGTTLAARADSRHWVVMDGAETTGGSSAASSPKELLLFALGGCTAMDVIPILKKKRSPVERCEVHLTADVREEHPMVYTGIHIEYVFYGQGIVPADVEHAIELSITKYCAVSAMLAPSVPLTHSYRIERGKAAADKQDV